VAGQLYSFDPPDRFVAGTVGEPGERSFYLQVRGGGQLVTVGLEKVQVAALAERLDQLLDEVRRRDGPTSDVPPAPPEPEDNGPLESPLLEDFRVGTLALAWDSEDRRVVVEAQELVGEEQSEEDADLLRLRLTAAAARAFARRAARVVAAGRPPCPLCGLPLDAEGHVCPRQNGHRG
jgi:uncharacterized repeat protein (TIGR03847 family)